MNSVTSPERTSRSRSLAIASAMVALILVLLPHAVSATPSQATPDSVPLFDNLGTHHYTITTSVPLAQRYFDQGLKLYYAFNHGEAVRAFEEASRLDSDCAMCYWGLALAYGPNINAPMEREAALAASVKPELPPKPKRMRWATYERWEAKYDAAEEALNDYCVLA